MASGGSRERMLEIFNDSLDRCRHRGDLPDAFYERFLAVPGVQPYFAGTDFARQKRILTSSLYLLMEAASGGPRGREHLEHLAEVHGKLGIPAEMYTTWFACMLNAVAALDRHFDAEVAAAWRAVLLPGIEVMKGRAPVRPPAAADAGERGPCAERHAAPPGANVAARERLLDTIEARVDELPLLPGVVSRLSAMDPASADFTDGVEQLARLDPTLTARLLHLATGGTRLLPRGMPTIGTAINQIGARRLAEAITSLSVMRVFVPTTAGQRNLWWHAVGTALAARRIAEMAPARTVVPEQAYLAGLMHDLGRFVMYDRSPRELGRVDETHWGTPAELIAAELAICGFDHASLGALACERWGFPEAVTVMVRTHHAYGPAAPKNDVRDLVQVLQAADFASVLLMTKPACLAASLDDRTRTMADWFARTGWREPPCEAGMLAEQLSWIAAETSRHAAMLGLASSASLAAGAPDTGH